MSIEISLKIGQYSATGNELPDVDEVFIRPSYTISVTHRDMPLALGVKTLVVSHLAAVELVYVHITGTATDVTMFLGADTTGVEFDSTLLVWGLTSETAVYLQADLATTVDVYLGGT